VPHRVGWTSLRVPTAFRHGVTGGDRRLVPPTQVAARGPLETLGVDKSSTRLPWRVAA